MWSEIAIRGSRRALLLREDPHRLLAVAASAAVTTFYYASSAYSAYQHWRAKERRPGPIRTRPSFLLAREVALLGGWELLWVGAVCHRLAVLLVQQCAVVGGAYIDDVFAATAGDLVGPCGTISVVR